MNFEQELVKVLDKYYWKTMLTRPWILHRTPLFKEIWYEEEKLQKKKKVADFSDIFCF